MSLSIAGTYQLEKNENFVEYLVAIGYPEDVAKKVVELKPTLEVDINGDKIILESKSRVGVATSIFILDEEVDERMPNGVVLKSVAKLVGNNLTVTSKVPDGKVGKRVYSFTDTELIMTLSSEDVEAPEAKRFYKRI